MTAHDLTRQPTRSFAIELGFYSGEGEYRVWESNGFYAGYKPTGGPLLAQEIGYAMRLPELERAENIVRGDERLKASRIVTSHLAPTV